MATLQRLAASQEGAVAFSAAKALYEIMTLYGAGFNSVSRSRLLNDIVRNGQKAVYTFLGQSSGSVSHSLKPLSHHSDLHRSHMIDSVPRLQAIQMLAAFRVACGVVGSGWCSGMQCGGRM